MRIAPAGIVLASLVPWMAGAADGALGARVGSSQTHAWNEKMRGLGNALGRLLIDISSDRRFEDKRNFKEIEKDAREFAALAHRVSKGAGTSPDKDVTIEMISADFSDQAKYAAKALADGHRAYARVILSSMTQYCVACHTRTDNGVSFADPAAEKSAARLDPYSKGNYFAAIREFDRAYAEYEKIVADPAKASADVYGYERSLRAGLSIAVRVKRDAALGMRLVDRVIENRGAPYFLREQAKDWRKSLVKWKEEKPSQPKDPAQMFAEAERLTAEARSTQKFPADRSADVLFLRASGVIHELLGTNPRGTLGANALYLAGLSYDVLYDYGIRDSAEFYYRACIRFSPHTEIAAACYRKYEENVYFGYTGSGGTYIPSDVRARLDELESLSSVPSRTEGAKLQ